MNYNPPILTTDQLQNATQTQIAQAQYEFIVASTTFAFAVVTMYFVFKFLVWFLPKYWYRPNEDKK
jgi:uncharacterized membrane protein